ncbi:MAG TPA: MFS transporter [Burkholderiaceae bacterium]|nr:MFS transporter [Burkholderiaceae bacterium]
MSSIVGKSPGSARVPDSAPRPMSREEKTVIFASSLGTVFEWYDFYLFGSLAAFIGKQFFAPLTPTAQFIMTLLGFAAGFAVRPFGAVIFGRLGDMVGRKYTFLITILIMGISTLSVGLLPGYNSWGITAPVILISLRLLQGLALGGEYGGAATYVAEHAPMGKRGYYTSWIQTTATLGLFLSLLVILGTRVSLGDKDFADWGWRVPFWISALLLAISVWIRLKLNESPAFQRMKAEGKQSKAPLTESFGRWGNLKIVLLALFGLTAGQAVVWYTGQFYALFFLTQTLKVDLATANYMIAASLLIGSPFFIFFGSLSDRVGRKPIIMAGCLLAVLTYFPLFKSIAHYANPALETAQATAPVTVVADPQTCSFQFNPTGTSKFTRPCDVAKSALASASVNYKNESAAPGTPPVVKFGDKSVAYADVLSAAGGDEKKAADDLRKALAGEVKATGYPAKADPGQINYVMVVLLLTILVIYVTMVYGPIAAMLVELFPTRIRYTSMSLPYHIGNGWFGGFLPATAFAIVAATGDIYSGLWYPIAVAAMTLVIGTLFVSETKDRDIYAND